MAINKTKVAASFSRAAQDYAEHAVLQRTVAERLLERLELVSISPNVIVDVGSGPGGAARQLAKRYKGAQLLQFDLFLLELFLLELSIWGLIKNCLLVKFALLTRLDA